MKHPTREEWMSYLYDESPTDLRRLFQAHLRDCAACRAQIETWQGATRQMNEWPMPPRRRGLPSAGLVRWAAAAVVVVLATVGVTNLLAMKREVSQLRAEVRVQLQGELDAALAQVTEQASQSATAEAQRLIVSVAQKLEEKQIHERQTLLTALQKLNAQRITDYAKLRKELETVALFSEAGWQRAENQISSLAYQPASFSNEK